MPLKVFTEKTGGKLKRANGKVNEKGSKTVDKLEKCVEVFGGSGKFARLWAFYREYIQDDAELLDFFWGSLKDHSSCKESVKAAFADPPTELINKIPMFYCVERFIEKAELIYHLCPSDQAFVVVLWISMIEHFQNCASECCSGYKTWDSKRGKIRAFFESASQKSKEKIKSIDFRGLICPLDTSVQDFADWLYAIRKNAVHEGKYGEPVFNNDTRDGSLMVLGKVNKCDKLDKKSICKELKRICPRDDRYVNTTLGYRDIRNIIVDAAIQNIRMCGKKS